MNELCKKMDELCKKMNELLPKTKVLYINEMNELCEKMKKLYVDKIIKLYSEEQHVNKIGKLYVNKIRKLFFGGKASDEVLPEQMNELYVKMNDLCVKIDKLCKNQADRSDLILSVFVYGLRDLKELNENMLTLLHDNIIHTSNIERKISDDCILLGLTIKNVFSSSEK